MSQPTIDDQLKKIFNYLKTSKVFCNETYSIYDNKIKFTVSADSIDVIEFNEKFYRFHEKSRNVEFINLEDNTREIHFVYSKKVIESYMKKNKFDAYSLNDSMNSKKDLEDFLTGDEIQIYLEKNQRY